jgi:hypothetical protein
MWVKFAITRSELATALQRGSASLQLVVTNSGRVQVEEIINQPKRGHSPALNGPKRPGRSAIRANSEFAVASHVILLVAGVIAGGGGRSCMPQYGRQGWPEATRRVEERSEQRSALTGGTGMVRAALAVL